VLQQPQQLKKKQSVSKRGGRHNSSSSSSSNHGNNKLAQQSKHDKLKSAQLGFQQLIDKNDDDVGVRSYTPIVSANTNPILFLQLSSHSSSSTFSSSSQQQSSVDYEAEDENEDKQRRPLHKNENDSLLHVQNFLKCFGPNAYASAKAPPPATATKSLAFVKSPGEGAELRAWRQNYCPPINTVQVATTTATSQAPATTLADSTAANTPMFQAQSSANHKPTKFQINTKFLRKPRNKLLKMLPTATATSAATAPKQQEQLQQPQLFNDDSNAKFKDFSIDSLLNK